jgi:hypothetical protein
MIVKLGSAAGGRTLHEHGALRRAKYVQDVRLMFVTIYIHPNLAKVGVEGSNLFARSNDFSMT